jgi:hypothetical protein
MDFQSSVGIRRRPDFWRGGAGADWARRLVGHRWAAPAASRRPEPTARSPRRRPWREIQRSLERRSTSCVGYSPTSRLPGWRAKCSLRRRSTALTISRLLGAAPHAACLGRCASIRALLWHKHSMAWRCPQSAAGDCLLEQFLRRDIGTARASPDPMRRCYREAYVTLSAKTLRGINLWLDRGND